MIESIDLKKIYLWADGTTAEYYELDKKKKTLRRKLVKIIY